MHELGLVNYVVKSVTKIAEQNGLTKIRSVTLDFGEVSGIITTYLYQYWDWYTKKFPLFDGAKLICNEIPAVSRCGDCNIFYSTVAYGKACPKCGGNNTWLVRGNEMMIREIEGGSYDESGNENGAEGT